MKTSAKITLIVLGAMLACGLALAQEQQDEPSLADMARQSREQKAKAAKEFDEDNFQRSKPAPQAQAPAAKEENAAEKKDSTPDDIKALEKQLADLKKGYELTDTRIKGIQKGLDESTMNAEARASMVSVQDGFKKKLADIQAQIVEVQAKLDAAKAAHGGGDAPAADTKPADGDSKPAEAASSDTGDKPAEKAPQQ